MKTKTVVEIVLSYISIGWAIVLFTSPGLFESSESWNQIQAIAPYEWIVGLVASVCATTKIVGMIIHNRKMRWIGLLMSTGLWALVAAGMLVSKGYIDFSTGFIVYSAVAVLSLFTAKEVNVDYDRAD